MSRASEILRRLKEQKKREQLVEETQPVSLSKLYERHKSCVYSIRSRCTGNMKGPFLIDPNNGYWRSATRVAFVGQQTNGWSSSGDISTQMKEYRDFDLGRDYRPSPFWNVIRKLENRLVGSNYSSAWLNLNRYDENNDKPSPCNLEILSQIDFLLLEELQLIKPHILIFFTGPDFKDRVRKLLQGTELPVTAIDRLFKINSPILKSLIFYADHPKYLRLTDNEQRVIDAICAEVAHRPQRVP